jgi:hypothetical protein
MALYRAVTFDHGVDKSEVNPFGIFEVNVADDDEFWKEVDKQISNDVEVIEVFNNG